VNSGGVGLDDTVPDSALVAFDGPEDGVGYGGAEISTIGIVVTTVEVTVTVTCSHGGVGTGSTTVWVVALGTVEGGAKESILVSITFQFP
jgi:hypothetical protein